MSPAQCISFTRRGPLSCLLPRPQGSWNSSPAPTQCPHSEGSSEHPAHLSTQPTRDPSRGAHCLWATPREWRAGGPSPAPTPRKARPAGALGGGDRGEGGGRTDLGVKAPPHPPCAPPDPLPPASPAHQGTWSRPLLVSFQMAPWGCSGTVREKHPQALCGAGTSRSFQVLAAFSRQLSAWQGRGFAAGGEGGGRQPELFIHSVLRVQGTSLSPRGPAEGRLSSPLAGRETESPKNRLRSYGQRGVSQRIRPGGQPQDPGEASCGTPGRPCCRTVSKEKGGSFQKAPLCLSFPPCKMTSVGNTASGL